MNPFKSSTVFLCLKILLICINPCHSYAEQVFPTRAPSPVLLEVDNTVTGAITQTSTSIWYEIHPSTAPVHAGLITDVLYECTLQLAPSNFLMHLYESNKTTSISQTTGNTTIAFSADQTPLYLNIQPDLTGIQTGSYQVGFLLPIQVRQIADNNQLFNLVWQGNSNSTYSIESAISLTFPYAFTPYLTDIQGTNLLYIYSNGVAPDPDKYYRIVKQTPDYTNRMGRVIFFSDMHISPFVNTQITQRLHLSSASKWDQEFLGDTNGFFGVDATGYETASPALFKSALTNAFAICPQPDAIVIPGDFTAYDFKSTYQQITGYTLDSYWKDVKQTLYEYLMLKIRETFPNAPIYACLGNNDSFTNDYDIAIGGEFLAATDYAMYHYGLSNVLAHTSFSATYTNAGNYTAPFGSATIIALESSFFSYKYPGPLSEGSNQLAYLETQLADCDADSRAAWVLLHIPPGIDAYDTWSHWATGDTSYAHSDWKADFTKPFLHILATYSNTVRNVICGHYHNRSWGILNDPATSNAIAPLQICSGIYFNHGNNPAFTVVTYDRDTLDFVREFSYSLDYNTYKGYTNAVSWSDRYSENMGFHVDSLTKNSLLAAWQEMGSSNSPGFMYYREEYTGGRTPYTISSNSWQVYYGVLRWMTTNQFLDNIP